MLTSLLLSEWGWRFSQFANFFLLPTRAWELLAGSLGAFWIYSRGNRANEAFSLLGMLFVVLSIFLLNGEMPFPSFLAVLPVSGALLILLFAQSGTIVAAVLSFRPVVMIGLLSYSAYLWHQPVFAYARRFQMEESSGLGLPLPHFSATQIALMLFLVFFFAFISWRYIELRFRTKKSAEGQFWRLFWFQSSVASLSAMFVLGVSISFFGETVLKSEKPQGGASAVLSDTWSSDVRQFECLLQDGSAMVHAQSCFEQPGNILLWGDSHAASLSIGLRKAFSELGLSFSQATQSGCGPLLNLPNLVHRKNCNEINDEIIKRIAAGSYNTIVLHAAWLHMHYPLSETEIPEYLGRTLDEIRRVDEDIRIVVVGAVPRWKNGPQIQSASEVTNRVIFGSNPFILTDLNLALKKVAVKSDAVFVDPAEYLCTGDGKEKECVLAVSEGGDARVFTYSVIDYGHLSKAGSEYLVKEWLDEDLAVFLDQ